MSFKWNVDPVAANEISVLAIVVKVAQLIFLIVLMSTMANIDGKLYWLVNTLSIFPQLLTCFCLWKFMGGSSLFIKLMPIMCFVEILIAFE